MASTLNDSGACTPTIKNTFLDFKLPVEEVRARRKSVPASMRECKDSLCFGKFSIAHLDSDLSTADGSTCSESGIKTPIEDGFACDSYSSLSELCSQEYLCQPPPQACESHQRLSSKASLFKPQGVEVEPAKEHYKHHFVDVVTWSKNVLQESEYVQNVEVHEDGGTLSIVIQPNGQGDKEWQTEAVLTLAKEVLLDAASKSRCIYLMGYCSPKPFIMQPQGFEATLGAMESPVSACWHVFKKGFCRHGDVCAKMHPVVQQHVRVLVESVQLNSSSRFVSNFKQEVADLTMAVIASLGECSYTDKVEAFKDQDCQGWTIEVTLKADMSMHKNYILTIAKSALYSATNNSNTVYIMGYAAKPFQLKSRGFVTLLGDMQDESVACWDIYSKGMCRHDCACRWSHPECLVPINVAVKESPLSLTA